MLGSCSSWSNCFHCNMPRLDPVQLAQTLACPQLPMKLLPSCRPSHPHMCCHLCMVAYCTKACCLYTSAHDLPVGYNLLLQSPQRWSLCPSGGRTCCPHPHDPGLQQKHAGLQAAKGTQQDLWDAEKELDFLETCDCSTYLSPAETPYKPDKISMLSS